MNMNVFNIICSVPLYDHMKICKQCYFKLDDDLESSKRHLLFICLYSEFTA